MRLERMLSTIEINHRSNKPIYPITFQIDNDNNAIIRSVMSTKFGRKDRHSPEFQKRTTRYFSSSSRFLHVQNYTPLQLISSPSINGIKG